MRGGEIAIEANRRLSFGDPGFPQRFRRRSELRDNHRLIGECLNEVGDGVIGFGGQGLVDERLRARRFSAGIGAPTECDAVAERRGQFNFCSNQVWIELQGALEIPDRLLVAVGAEAELFHPSP